MLPACVASQSFTAHTLGQFERLLINAIGANRELWYDHVVTDHAKKMFGGARIWALQVQHHSFLNPQFLHELIDEALLNPFKFFQVLWDDFNDCLPKYRPCLLLLR